MDFVLHGDGPASTWAAQAQTGQVLFLMGPGLGYKLPLQAPEHLLIGDDSALPAFETILASLPATARARVLVEVVDAAEERTLHSPGRIDVQWAVRGPDNRSAGRALEAGAMRRIRQLLTDELGVARGQIVGRGYWKLGTMNHPDHDYGEDA